ncbi:MAG: prolyl-tRNA synthetase associated domain-containing protein [Acetobacteraceae bacterium]|nr:prolyl-tRNA synthetase associated domain-containing protein [Acetobacteraceae bacterium]
MRETPEGLLARLTALGIEHRVTHHPAVFTVAESQALRGQLDGGHTKNLFLRPKSGPFLLITLEEARQVGVNAVVRAAGAPRASFADAAALMEQLGVAPGSVTPLGLVNARPGAVRAIFDRHLVEDCAWINVHPLTNTATVTIRPRALLELLRGFGHLPEVMALE